MEILCVLENVGELRQFDGNNGGKVSVVDVTLKSGADVLQASAFDELAKGITSGEIGKNTLYFANVRFSVRRTEKGTFQSGRIESMHKVFDADKCF